MPVTEFSLINQFFTNCGLQRDDCILGVGDDAALLHVPSNHELVVTQDTLVAGIHFFANTDPYSLGHKALAVNLSDLAAMGANAAWFTLSLTLPTIDVTWIKEFANGLHQLACNTGVRLIGGDTTRGDLSISITALGIMPSGQALRRCGAQPGDDIYVSGTLGDAGMALRQMLRGESVANEVRTRLDCPMPRLKLGQTLRGIAHAAIDISDGLAADLKHILEASQVGAELQLAQIPISPFLANYLERNGDHTLPLIAGDDYELCFTVSPNKSHELTLATSNLDCNVTRIGIVTVEPSLKVYDANGQMVTLTTCGYEHFTC
jgi:thiamine-monophosphate kinase